MDEFEFNIESWV